jgi:hypothetical protein
MYAVIDYEGAAGTVRARIYQGTSDAGTLRADVTNRLGNPATLPAGTVFGFTGATSNYTQTTYIDSLRITTTPAATLGAPFYLQTWTSAPWNAVSGATSISGVFSSGGSPVTFTFSAPRTGVNITVPSAPNFTGSAASFFGIEPTGFGVGNSGLGRFDRGESFTLQSSRRFSLNEINWAEWTGDEQVHIRWTSGGVVQQQVFNTPAALATFTNLTPDANTPVVITNVSSDTANLLGRLRVNRLRVAVFQ